MHLSTVYAFLITWTLTSATNIDNHFGTNCGGGYLHYSNIAARRCTQAYIQSGSTVMGSKSAYFSSKPASAYTYGWEETRDGNICGALARQGKTGTTTLCLPGPSGGATYAGTSWASASKKRSDGAEVEECTSGASPDALVLDDGHMFGLHSMNETMFEELYEIAYNGASFASLPAKFHGYEIDAAGVAGRLAAMTARQSA